MSSSQSSHVQRSTARSLAWATTLSVVAHFVLFFATDYGHMQLGANELSATSIPRPLQIINLSAPQEPLGDGTNSLTTATPSQESRLRQELEYKEPQDVGSRLAATSTSSLGVALSSLYYYPVEVLDIRPAVIKAPQIENTLQQTESLLINGYAKLELLVEKTGKVNTVNIRETNLPEPYPSILRKTFSDIEYSPSLLQGHQVRSRILIEVTYADGILSDATNSTQDGRIQLQAKPHSPIELPPERHTRKVNPPSKQ